MHVIYGVALIGYTVFLLYIRKDVLNDVVVKQIRQAIHELLNCGIFRKNTIFMYKVMGSAEMALPITN